MKQVFLMTVAAWVLVACGPAKESATAAADAGAPAQSVASAQAPAMSEEQLLQIAEGRDIAIRNCAGCHALDDDTSSPRADAPPMRDLLARYDAEALADDLIAGIKLGHEDMPQFDFNVIAADALVAYLRSIRPNTAPVNE